MVNYSNIALKEKLAIKTFVAFSCPLYYYFHTYFPIKDILTKWKINVQHHSIFGWILMFILYSKIL